MTEESIYSDKNIKITSARVAVGGTTYALRNVTSVKMTMTPPSYGCLAIAIIANLLVVVAIIGAFMENSASAGDLVGGVLFVALFVLGLVYAIKTTKPDYHVEMHSASGEARVFSSRDKGYIENIVQCINEAIIRCR